MRVYSFSLKRINKEEKGHGFRLTPPPQWVEVLGQVPLRNRWIHAKYALYDVNPKHPGDDTYARFRPTHVTHMNAILDNTWKDRPIYTVHLYTIGKAAHDDPTRQLTWGVAWRSIRWLAGSTVAAKFWDHLEDTCERYQHFWNEAQARAFYEAKCNE